MATLDLSKYGIQDVKEIIHNPSYDVLFAEETKSELEGFEKDYSEWSNLRIATYTNLKPGTYTFNVIAQNGDEIQSEDTAKLTIVKKPYFYQRPMFLISVLVIILGLAILIIKLRFNRLEYQKQKKEKMSISAELTF